MKLRSLFFGTLCMLMLGVSFTSCSDDAVSYTHLTLPTSDLV